MIDDDWFADGFETFKVPRTERYEVAGAAGILQTLEGPIRYMAGHYIMTGPAGERYPITPQKFAQLKDDNGDGTATPKKIMKIAKLADHDGVIHATWGDMKYYSGSEYIVKHGPNDYGAVQKDIFEQTYHIAQTT